MTLAQEHFFFSPPFIEPMTGDVESTTTTPWGGAKRDRGQVAFSCGMPGADLERFLVLS